MTRSIPTTSVPPRIRTLPVVAFFLLLVADPGPPTCAQVPEATNAIALEDSSRGRRGSDEASPGVVQHIQSEAVCLRVAELRGELELLRFHMGRPRDERLGIRVRGASAREAYFQAVVLLENTERLAFEFVREREEVPELPETPATLDDVRAILDIALARVERIKNQLRISGSGTPVEPRSCADANDVLHEIVLANRQLNLLLERPVAPEDVFQQVSLGIAHLSRILERFPEPTRIPEPPPLEPGRVPGDVFRRLLVCFDRLHTVLAGSGLTVLEFEVSEQDLAAIVPSDVLHLSSMLVAELAMIHRALPETLPARRVFPVGRKFPSHVHQRVAVLEQMLEEFALRVAAHPGWLEGDFEE